VGREGRSTGAAAVKRPCSPSGYMQENAVVLEASKEDDGAKHCDADVLTKVVVYAGIGTVRTVIVPVMFEALVLGV